MSEGIRKNLLPIGILLVLSSLVLAVFLQTAGYPFITMDDENYLHRNPRIQGGLTREGAAWAFTSDMDAGWIPLTWLSRMADVSLFGMDAGRHHSVNVIFHLVNTLLLFLVLRRMTGKEWESGTVAALFAIHPLHVESVAWVIERKDVLSAFFWMLSLGAYARYASRPGIARYGLVLLFFILGLMSKPIVVTLPFVLLLLDYWPLCRWHPPGISPAKGAESSTSFDSPGGGAKENPAEKENVPVFQPASAGRLLLEKLPLIVLAAADSVYVFIAHGNVGSIRGLDSLPLWARAGNALDAYASYLWKAVWPSKLAVFYPHPGKALVLWETAVAGLFLCLVSALVAVYARRRRWLATGWLWYLGTLFPVIGLVQAGEQAMADRYTYLPLVGVFLAAVWEVFAIAESRPAMRNLLKAAVPAVILSLASMAWVQTRYWRDSVALFTRSLAVTENNWKMRYNLGLAYVALGCYEEGIASYREALKLPGAKSDVWFNLGTAYASLARFQEARDALRESVRIDPNDARSWNNLGMAYVKLGQFVEARDCFLRSIRLRPYDETSRRNLRKYIP